MIPISPARKTAGLEEFLCNVNEPLGPSICTAVPSGMLLSTRLKALSRILVAIVSWSSNGGLAMENVRMFPSASVSFGSSKVMSTAWAARNSKPCGRSK